MNALITSSIKSSIDRPIRSGNPQQGSALVVSLVFLLILTIAGLASIQLTSLEEKMTGNFRDEQLAFHAAEVAVQEAESFVEQTTLAPGSFSAGCTSGLCFSGSNSSDAGTCQADSVSPWEDEEVWEDNSRNRTTVIDLDGISAQARYLVEFRCFVPKETGGPDPDPSRLSDWAQFYRITVLATGGSTNARVMLQTTYKKND